MVNIRISGLCVICLLALACRNDEVRVIGKVYNSDGMVPEPNVHITISPGGVYTSTDSMGAFDIMVETSGSLIIHAQKENFADASTKMYEHDAEVHFIDTLHPRDSYVHLFIHNNTTILQKASFGASASVAERSFFAFYSPPSPVTIEPGGTRDSWAKVAGGYDVKIAWNWGSPDTVYHDIFYVPHRQTVEYHIAKN